MSDTTTRPHRVLGKRSRIVDALTTAIRSGELGAGQQLEGENALARRFAVSRGTIRQALMELQNEGMITTVGGVGSFVSFDGVALDQSLGWARALQLAGGEISTTVVDITLLPWDDVVEVAAEDARATEAEAAVRIRRLRTLPDGVPVSYEVSFVPAHRTLADLPRTGLVNESIWATLAAAGLRAVTGTQDAGVGVLDEEASRLLDREPGTPFLHTNRWSYGADGILVEFVSAFLDPARFRLTTTFERP